MADNHRAIETVTRHIMAQKIAHQIVTLLVEDGLEYSYPSKYFEYRICHFCNRTDYEEHVETCEWGKLLKLWRELQPTGELT